MGLRSCSYTKTFSLTLLCLLMTSAPSSSSHCFSLTKCAQERSSALQALSHQKVTSDEQEEVCNRQAHQDSIWSSPQVVVSIKWRGYFLVDGTDLYVCISFIRPPGRVALCARAWLSVGRWLWGLDDPGDPAVAVAVFEPVTIMHTRHTWVLIGHTLTTELPALGCRLTLKVTTQSCSGPHKLYTHVFAHWPFNFITRVTTLKKSGVEKLYGPLAERQAWKRRSERKCVPAKIPRAARVMKSIFKVYIYGWRTAVYMSPAFHAVGARCAIWMAPCPNCLVCTLRAIRALRAVRVLGVPRARDPFCREQVLTGPFPLK